MAPPLTVVAPPLRVSRDFIDYPYHCDLGPVQAVAVLRAAGMPVHLVDAFALPGSDLVALEGAWIRLGASPEAVLAEIPPSAAVVVGYTPFHRPPAREPLLAALLEGLRAAQPEATVVLADLYQSGQHYVEAPGEAVLAAYPEVDVYLKYEAETRLPALLQARLERGRPSRPFWESGGEVQDLDALPLPAWDAVDLGARDAFLERVVAGLGRGDWAFPIEGRTLPAISSRGCPYRCAHCSSNPGRGAGPKTQRRLSPGRIEALVADLERHGATRIHVLDEMVNVDQGHFDALLAALTRRPLRFDFPNGMRADHLEAEHLDRMRGRIQTLSVSAESGSQRVVEEVVEKKLDLRRLEKAVAAAAERGLRTLVHFIIGNPGETREEINETLHFALHLWERYGAEPSVQFATPLPGTRLAERAQAEGPLPVVEDFGPLFQHRPVTRGEDWTPEDLRRFKWTFDQRIAAGRGPKKVIMNVTYRCNNRCTFCAVGTRTQLDGNFDRQRTLLARYRRAGVEQVDFDGGEPTLYEKLIPLIHFARALGYRKINVTTNGRLAVYRDYARRLVRSGLTSLLFSVHGATARTHAQNVGVAEAFDQTCEGIQNCVALAPEGVALGMNVTVTKSNHRELPAIARLCFDLGLRWLNVQFLTPFGRATSHVNPDTAEAARLTQEVIDTWGDRMKIQVINLPFCFMPGYEAHLVGDLLKIQRHMVFVTNDDVNLYEYLKSQRRYGPECAGCPHRVFCGGFYELENTPEAPWEFTLEDVERAV